MQNIAVKKEGTRNEIALKIECRTCEVPDITNTLGLAPTEVCSKESGEKAIWTYSVGKQEGVCTDSQIEELESVFAPKVYLVRKLKKRYFLQVYVEVTSEIIHGETPGLVFEKSFLRMLMEMGAEMKLNIQVNQEKMDVIKVNTLIGREDLEGLARYMQRLPESEEMKMAEYLLSCAEAMRRDGEAGTVWDALNTQNAETVMDSFLDAYYLESLAF